MYSTPDLLKLLLAERGEHVRVEAGSPPAFRVQGVFYEVEGPAVLQEDLDQMLRDLASTRQLREFRQLRALDFMYTFNNTLFLVRAMQCFDAFRLDFYLIHRWLGDRPPPPPNQNRPDIPI